MKPSLLILAAGLGSRYGGFKQTEPLGPNGEFIIDYSIHDALRAGFGTIVIVTQPQLEEPIREHLHTQLGDGLDLRFAYQELSDLPAGFSLPASRKKPWGTAHAIRSARDVITGPFGVINADDYYGPRSYQVLAHHLHQTEADHACMVGFELTHTLSDHGSVSRGICRTDALGALIEVVEHTRIISDDLGDAHSIDTAGQRHPLPSGTIASMNMWGFDSTIFGDLEELFRDFLEVHGREEKAEFFIPSIVDELIKRGRLRCSVLHTPEQWFGVTYQEDRAAASGKIHSLIEDRTYPVSLHSSVSNPSPYATAFH